MDVATLPLPASALAFAFAGVLGLAVGSFLNVVIHRLPLGGSLLWPGSHCPRCQAPIRWYDNLPLLSYLLLRGRCRRCSAGISPRYPIVELLTAALFVAMLWRHGVGPMLPVWWAFGAALLATAFIDFDHQIIPDEISLGGLGVALLAVPGAQALAGADFTSVLLRTVAGAVLGGGILWSVGFAHARLSASMGRRFPHWPGDGEALPTPGSVDYWMWFPGVGFGDVKLLAMIGAVLGPMGVLFTILASSLTGLALGVGFALLTRQWNAPFGFGPAIAAGALLVALLPVPLAFPGA